MHHGVGKYRSLAYLFRNNPATPAVQPAEPVEAKPGQQHFHQAIAALHKKDYKTAQASLQQAVEEGHTLALVQLGRLYRAGTGVERDIDMASVYFKKASEAGDGEGEHQLGLLHLHSTGRVDLTLWPLYKPN